MPIVHKEYIGDHGVLGVWKITESLEELLDMIEFTEGDAKVFEQFKNKARQTHWLSYRLAIRRIMGDITKLEFYYDEHGKLHFQNHQYNLSVTHSGDYSAVIISNRHHVGIDLELISDRIDGLEDKFMNATEQKRLPEENREKYLTAFWGAKEALFKLYGKRELKFGENIFIDLKEIEDQGSFQGKIKSPDFERDYRINYRVLDNYMLVHSADDQTGI
jgi:phosphopantetheinyl transferase (holo-ACP synthase)